MRAHVTVALASVLLLACGPRTVKPPLEGPAGRQEKAMSHCPSAVPGAVTNMREVGDGLVLDVTADDPAAAEEIATRAQVHATMGAPITTEMAHTGRHGGPGDVGHCPVIHLGTTVTVEEILGGARITVIATDPATAPELRKLTRERLAWFDPTKAAPTP